MNLPNKLTIARMILIVPIIILFSIFTWYVITFENGEFKNVNLQTPSQYFLYTIGIIFIISMITDFLDGHFARKNNQITVFGKLFDPLADKITITITLIFLSYFQYTYIYIVIFMIIRDLIVDGSRNIFAKNNLKIEASIYGKLKTIFQSVAIPIILFLIPIVDSNVWWQLLMINIPMIIALFLSIYSGYQYFKQVIPFLKG
ncbi:CDP-diacylglycerol--glycerol-3-phosphate 3-phosphatidyltransferase [Metamycoplasma sualvi]|uniref:CDP-diacylglycerol--glycerol-3-phosphate 3-phosphatidyltransferase n=1 Tax=Metamycoplasma sualvi TaxID=2125 RepID=UPI0038736271